MHFPDICFHVKHIFTHLGEYPLFCSIVSSYFLDSMSFSNSAFCKSSFTELSGTFRVPTFVSRSCINVSLICTSSTYNLRFHQGFLTGAQVLNLCSTSLVDQVFMFSIISLKDFLSQGLWQYLLPILTLLLGVCIGIANRIYIGDVTCLSYDVNESA